MSKRRKTHNCPKPDTSTTTTGGVSRRTVLGAAGVTAAVGVTAVVTLTGAGTATPAKAAGPAADCMADLAVS